MTVDHSIQTEVEIARATIVIVGARPSSGDVPGVRRISPDELTAVLEASPSPVQPGQLWLLAPGTAGLVESIRNEIERHGALVEEAEHELDAWRAIGRHLAREASLQRQFQTELRRENTTLRRELNRALSALDHRHPILGLLPSATVDDLAANRRPGPPVPAADAAAVLISTDDLPLQLVRATSEVRELREQLDAIGRTKVMRWSRLPRRLYARIRQL